MAFEVTVDQVRCNGCEQCVDVCTSQVLRIADGKAVPGKMEDCLGCESCVGVCEEKAISVTDSRMKLSETCRSLLRDIL